MRAMTLHTRTGGLHNSAGASPLADIDRDLVRLRERLEAAIEGAIALLDRLDAPAEDLEDGGDWEPWLATPEGYERQLPWCRGGDDDREISEAATRSPRRRSRGTREEFRCQLRSPSSG